MSARVRLDQHYLVDGKVRDSMVAAIGLTPEDRVLEIGPGRGMLTRVMLPRVRELVAIELDDRMAPQLPDAMGRPANLKVIHADFLEYKLAFMDPGLWKVAANLPYAVATPILQKLLTWPQWQDAVLMFQKEVAERIVADPGGCDYGLLGLSVAIHAQAHLLLDVPRGCFRPRPKVDSAVVLLRRRQQPLVPEPEQAGFFRVARAAFGQRRKMALGVLARGLGLPRERVAEAFAAGGIAESARAEEIALAGFRDLARRLVGT
ncbi:MAG: 16S rRNA (adenine(1518)-N(6)/adenine(1519)-N(6))-dimethyltransferase RsmA [Elusimicrobiota bacterium]|jgi:16S rRNA (adenine1518-N6/adenine1519-N6)-dimethyltransferase